MRTLIILFTVAMLGFTASAQQNPLKQRIKNLQKKTQQRPRIDLETEPAGEPVDELTVDEFMLKRKDLAGKVIELEFDRVVDLKQIDQGYSARVMYESLRGVESISLLIPKEGFDFFEKLAEQRGSKREDVYVEVLGGNVVRALGTRFSKNKPEGERYSW